MEIFAENLFNQSATAEIFFICKRQRVLGDFKILTLN